MEMVFIADDTGTHILIVICHYLLFTILNYTIIFLREINCLFTFKKTFDSLQLWPVPIKLLEEEDDEDDEDDPISGKWNAA